MRLPSRRPKSLLILGTWAVLAVLVVLALVRMVGMGQKYSALLWRPGASSEEADRSPTDGIPPFEIFPYDEDSEKEEPFLPEIHSPDRIPKVAIIIDDLGYDRRKARAFIDLGYPLTLSILPRSPFQKEIIEAALLSEMEILLHLPMEPREYPKVDPGPGALFMAMTPDVFVQELLANLDALPSIKGVNNHMGSRITEDRDRMTILFSVLKERGLFFVDSLTTAKSRAGEAARLTNLDFARRDVFLDHVSEPEFVERQMDRLLARARRKGTAIGIAHPNAATYRVLRSRLPQMDRHAALVPASSIVYLRQTEGKGLEMPGGAVVTPEEESAQPRR